MYSCCCFGGCGEPALSVLYSIPAVTAFPRRRYHKYLSMIVKTPALVGFLAVTLLFLAHYHPYKDP